MGVAHGTSQANPTPAQSTPLTVILHPGQYLCSTSGSSADLHCTIRTTNTPPHVAHTLSAMYKCTVRDAYRVGSEYVPGMGVSEYEMKPLSPVRLQVVDSLAQYMTPCALHTHGCIGHMVKWRGVTLPPSSLVVLEPTPNELGCAIQALFDTEDRAAYHEALKVILNGKRGLFRDGCMSGKVVGSLRTVIVPAPGVPRGSLYLPRAACDKMTYPGIMSGSNVVQRMQIREGQWVIAVRPPTLYYSSIRPYRVCMWDKDVIGLPIDHCSDIHGDFDGDEMQVYPVCWQASLRECEGWVDAAVKPPLHTHTGPMVDVIGHEGFMTGSDAVMGDWCRHTTRPLHHAPPHLTPAEIAMGTKAAQWNRYCITRRTQYDPEAMYRQSVEGMTSVMLQQLPQGEIGGITRVAKVSASEVITTAHGLRWGNEHMQVRGHTLDALPGVTGLAKVCARIQQRALDAHRGVAQGGVNVAGILLDGNGLHHALSLVRGVDHAIVSHSGCVQVIDAGGGLVVLFTVGVGVLRMIPTGTVVGSTNTTLVQRVGHANRVGVAATGVNVVNKLLHLNLTEHECMALGWVISRSPTRTYPFASISPTDESLGGLTRLVGTYCTNENVPVPFTGRVCDSMGAAITFRNACLIRSRTHRDGGHEYGCINPPPEGGDA